MSLRSALPEKVKDAIGRPLGWRGVEPRSQWLRHVMNAQIDGWIRDRDPTTLDAVEISGQERAHHPWRSFVTLDYPAFDLCAPETVITNQYDVVICEQVIEHVVDPKVAFERLFALTRAGGHAIVSTPFLIRVHAGPGDYWRFTQDALAMMLERAGFSIASVGSWGNRPCVRANLLRWARLRPWHSLKNDPRFPIVVWAIGQRPDPSS